MISLIRNASVERMEVDAYVQDEATRRVLIVEMGYFAWLRIGEHRSGVVQALRSGRTAPISIPHDFLVALDGRTRRLPTYLVIPASSQRN